jgi:hypothetical protein
MLNSSWPPAMRYQAIGRDGRHLRTPATTATTMPSEAEQ